MNDVGSRAHFLEGPRLYLRDLRPDDVGERYRAWMNDAAVMRFMESRFVSHSIESLRAYVAEKARSSDTIFLAIVTKATKRHIGNIKLGPIHPVHRRGDIGIIIGEKDCWGRGYATEAIEILTRYAFEQLHLHKLTAGCYADNSGSTRAFEKAGFTREGVRLSHLLSGDGYVDEILLGRVQPASEDSND